METAVLNRFANIWGWPPLKRCHHVMQNDGEVIVWWESKNNDDLFLQVNVQTQVENGFLACVYACRYRICSGWYPFVASQDDRDNNAEAERLRDSLHFDRFATGKSRTAYRKQFPHAIGFMWWQEVPIMML